MNRYLIAFVALLLASGAPAEPMPPSPAATPVDPISAIIEAFRTRNIVTLTDPLGNVQIQAFLLALIGAPRFPDTINDVVIETASALPGRD